MDPQQELFTKLLTEIKALGYDVYDGFLPPDGTPYPFVYFADNQQIDEAIKRYYKDLQMHFRKEWIMCRHIRQKRSQK